MRIKVYILSNLFMLLGFTSCESLLDINPPTDAMTVKQMFSTKEGIEIAAKGLYTNNFLNNSLYTQYLEIYLGFMSDELLSTSGGNEEYYQNNYSSKTNAICNFWTLPYQTIYQCNDFIINVEGNSAISDEEANTYLGEACFFRAYSYFLLVNCFGDVPLVLTNDYRKASIMPRTSKKEIYEQIIKDLMFAEEHLINSNNAQTKITSESAKALLARVYLYTGDYKKAIAKASELIPVTDGGAGNKFELEAVDRVFKASGKESILYINMNGFSGAGTYDGYTRLGNLFIPLTNKITYYLNEGLVDDIRSNEKDKRNAWIKSILISGKEYFYAYKYRNARTPVKAEDAEYMVLLRLAELYLIRAEASIRLNDFIKGYADLNKIRQRAGLDELPLENNQEKALMAIEQERRKEFFVECGHRWFDLNRTNRSDEVYKNISYKIYWASYKSLFPIPADEIGRNPNLIPNEGY